MTTEPEDNAPELHFGLPLLPGEVEPVFELAAEWEIEAEDASLTMSFYEQQPVFDARQAEIDAMMAAMLIEAGMDPSLLEAPELHFGLPDTPEEIAALLQGLDDEWEVSPDEAYLLDVSMFEPPRTLDPRIADMDAMMASLAGMGFELDMEAVEGWDLDMLLLEAAIMLDENWEEL
jgi:hypothetical protein